MMQQSLYRPSPCGIHHPGYTMQQTPHAPGHGTHEGTPGRTGVKLEQAEVVRRRKGKMEWVGLSEDGVGGKQKGRIEGGEGGVGGAVRAPTLKSPSGCSNTS
eukprot:1139932-Pelagomonas_calceolata.AAC.2